jgi:hypothetical protein
MKTHAEKLLEPVARALAQTRDVPVWVEQARQIGWIPWLGLGLSQVVQPGTTVTHAQKKKKLRTLSWRRLHRHCR